MAKNPKIELPLRNDFGILCDPKIAPQKTADTVCFTLPFIPLKPPFAGLDDLDSSPAMRADSGSWFERLVKPFVTALKARRRTFSGKASIMVKAMLKGPFFLSLRDWRKTLAQGVNTLLKFRSRFHVRKGWLVRLSRRVPAVWPVSFS